MDKNEREDRKGGGSMRETFDSFFGIIYYYYYLKANVGTMPGMFPSEDKIKGLDVHIDPSVQRAVKEDKMAFIGDVERFLYKDLLWYERIIFLKRVPASGDEETYENITITLNIEKRKNPHFKVFPKSLNNRGYASYVFKRSVKKGYVFFKNKGYLIDPRKNNQSQESCHSTKKT